MVYGFSYITFIFHIIINVHYQQVKVDVLGRKGEIIVILEGQVCWHQMALWMKGNGPHVFITLGVECASWLHTENRFGKVYKLEQSPFGLIQCGMFLDSRISHANEGLQSREIVKWWVNNYKSVNNAMCPFSHILWMSYSCNRIREMVSKPWYLRSATSGDTSFGGEHICSGSLSSKQKTVLMSTICDISMGLYANIETELGNVI